MIIANAVSNYKWVWFVNFGVWPTGGQGSILEGICHINSKNEMLVMNHKRTMYF